MRTISRNPKYDLAKIFFVYMYCYRCVDDVVVIMDIARDRGIPNYKIIKAYHDYLKRKGVI